MTGSKRLQYTSVIFIFLVVCVFTYFAAGELFLPSDELDDAYVCGEYIRF